MGFFSVATDISDSAADPVRRQCLEEDIAGFLQVVRAFFAGGVIENDYKIPLCSHPQPLFNLLPRGHKITQADEDKIMDQGRAEAGGAAEGGRDARDYADLHGRVFLRHLG